MPASSNGGGKCLAGPDGCKTPPTCVPVPYPNMAMGTQGKGSTYSKKVLLSNKKTARKGSEISKSLPHAGVLKGVKSNTFMDKVTYKKGSSKVKVEGKPMCHLTSMTAHNGSNANMPAGAQIAPSQTKVTCSP